MITRGGKNPLKKVEFNLIIDDLSERKINK